MKKQILNIGKALSKVEQKEISGGFLPAEVEAGPCRDAYPDMPNGCWCSRDHQCASGYCKRVDGSSMINSKCADRPETSLVG